MDANIATLKNGLSRYLKVVQTGEEVVVLDRSTPVARIVPFQAAPDAASADTSGPDVLDQMLHRGAISHRGNPQDVTEWLRHRSAPPAAPGTSTLSEQLLTMRDEEPW